MPVMGLIALERRGVGSFIHSTRWGLFERVDAWESGCCEIQATGARKGGIGAGRRISEREREHHCMCMRIHTPHVSIPDKTRRGTEERAAGARDESDRLVWVNVGGDGDGNGTPTVARTQIDRTNEQTTRKECKGEPKQKKKRNEQRIEAKRVWLGELLFFGHVREGLLSLVVRLGILCSPPPPSIRCPFFSLTPLAR